MTVLRRGVALVLLALLAAGCVGRARLLPNDVPAGELGALVDSAPARALLAELLARRARHPSSQAHAALPSDAADETEADAGASADPLLEQAALRALAQATSLDFAALTFVRALSADRRSRAVQASFEGYLRDDLARSEAALREPGRFPYVVLFAPSWMYRTHPETGADFAAQRRLLDRLDIANHLIPTAESAAVEDNAVAIAAAVRAAGREGRRLVIVSASKSGAEVALALSRVLPPADTAGVAAWVNIVGALGGSPLADSALRPPLSWVVRSVFWLSGWDWAGLTSMATERSRARLRAARLPDSIVAMNVVAVPLSGTVGVKVYFGYELLRDAGPNDGVVPLADAVWPGGVNLVALGPDHLFAPREDDAHSVALMRAVALAVQLHRVARDGESSPTASPARAGRPPA